MNTIGIILVITVTLAIGVILSWRSKNLLQTIAVSLSFVFISWLTMPLYVVLPEGSYAYDVWYSWPFRWYKLGGNIYIFAGTAAVAVLLYWIDKIASDGKAGVKNAKEINRSYMTFMRNAKRIYMIGRDLDFLKEPLYKEQCRIAERLGNKCSMLCEYTDNPALLELYHTLSKKGIRIRCYTSDDCITNLTGQIKEDDKGKMEAIFVSKHAEKKFIQTDLTNAFQVTPIFDHYNQLFEKSKDAVIRYIALDIGGVFFDGELYRDFFEKVESLYHVKIPRIKNDKLNIDQRVMKGEITIVRYISEKTGKIFSDAETAEILSLWSNVWHPNPDILKLMIQLKQSGYVICPFANLDQENGDMYLGRNDFYEFSDRHYFSYETGYAKPDKNAFHHFYKKEKEINPNLQPFQILLIDDQDKNINTAVQLGWKTVKFSIERESAEALREKLKKAGVV